MGTNATIGGTLGCTGVATFTAASVHSGGITSGGNIISDTDGTDDLGTTGVRWANVYADSIGDDGQALSIGATTFSFDAATSIDTSGNNALTITSGTAGMTLTAGTVAISTAATVGTTLGCTGVATFTATSVHTGGITSGSNIISDTDGTDNLGSAAVRWANVYTDSIGDNGQALNVAATTLSFDAASSIDTSGNNALTISSGTATMTLTAGTTAIGTNATVGGSTSS
jgi:ribosomal protein L18E